MANANFFSPDGGITRYPLEDTEGRTTYEEEIHGINLLDINLADLKSITLNGGTWNDNVYTRNGVTFTFNSEDKSIIINGTATANTDFYILKGSSGTSRPISELQSGMLLSGIEGDNDFYIQIVYRNASDGYLSQQNLTSGELAIEIPSNAFSYRIAITIANGKTVTNAVVKPMLTEAKYAGIPYRPYNQQSIQHQINDITGVTGVRNLLKIESSTQVLNGVTCTVNKDDNGNVLDITLNGTSTAPFAFRLGNYSSVPSYAQQFSLPVGKYKLTGLPVGSSGVSINMCWAANSTATRTDLVNIYGSERSFEFECNSPDNRFDAFLYILSGNTFNNMVIKPMISPASDPLADYDHYVPYAMTNRELTEIATQTEVVTLSRNTSNTTGADIKLFRYGKLRILTGFIAPTVEDATQADEHPMLASNLSSNDTPQDFARGLLGRMGIIAGIVVVYSDGKVQFTSSTTQNVYFNIAWIAK